MKILFVSTISNTINAFLIPHIKMLIDEGHTVDIACNIEKEVNPEIFKMGCKVHNIPFQRSPLSISNIHAYKEMKRIIGIEKYELVHTHTPVASTIVRLVCKKITNLKVLYTAHGFHFFKGAPLLNWLIFYPIEKYLAKSTDVIITMNEEDYSIASKKFKAKNIIKVHGVGVDLNKFVVQTNTKKQSLREEYSYSDDDFILVYVGELSYRKHQDFLINAISNITPHIPNIKVLLIGEGSLREYYENLIENYSLKNYVQLLGYRNDVASIMLMSDLVVSTSRQEGLPVNVMEGMATGIPLIVSGCRGNIDLVKDGVNGYVVSLDNVNHLSERILELYNNSKKQIEFKEKSKELITPYSINSVLVEMSNIYKKYL